jgi:antitoxin VapB
MGINIKNPETERLINELVQLTGQGKTEAITNAVREKLAREKRKGLAERLMAIAAETGPLLKDMPDHATLFYDEKTGLPK